MTLVLVKHTGKWLLSRTDTILRWTLELTVLILDMRCFLIYITNHHKLSPYNNTNSWSGNFVNERSLSWSIYSYKRKILQMWNLTDVSGMCVVPGTFQLLAEIISCVHSTRLLCPHWLVTEVSWLDCLLKAKKRAQVLLMLLTSLAAYSVSVLLLSPRESCLL